MDTQAADAGYAKESPSLLAVGFEPGLARPSSPRPFQTKVTKPVRSRLPRDGPDPDSDDAKNVVRIVSGRKKGHAAPVGDRLRRTHLPDMSERLAEDLDCEFFGLGRNHKKKARQEGGPD